MIGGSRSSQVMIISHMPSKFRRTRQTGSPSQRTIPPWVSCGIRWMWHAPEGPYFIDRSCCLQLASRKRKSTATLQNRTENPELPEERAPELFRTVVFVAASRESAAIFLTQAWFIKAGIDSDGLWTISRGLARHKADYQAALANADEKRMNDLDGRGYLSQRYFREFCHFFLTTAADQVEFMRELLALDGMLNRIAGYAERRESAKELPRGSALVLRELFLRGEIARGEVSRIIGASPRTAQKVSGELLSQRLITSTSPKGPLCMGFPADAAGHYFPNLYPAGAE